MKNENYMVDSECNTHRRQRQVVMLGESGFPKGLATVQRTTLMSKAFLHAKIKTTVICRKGVQKRNQGIQFPRKGAFEGVDYLYTVDSIYRPKGLIQRNWQKLKGMFGEYRYLKHLKKHEHIDMALVSELKVVHIARFLLYSRIFGFPIILNFMEMTSSMEHRSKPLKRINDYLLDRWIIKWFDGALPISDELVKYYRSVAPRKPNMKLPILCDFEKFDISKTVGEPYFLYCGSFRYKEVRDFIVEAYRNIPENKKTKLYMIVSGGSQKETFALQEELNAEFGTWQVRLFSDIPYVQLVYLYTNAIAMLIPLRPTVQDAARFPHKIGEYLASGNVVITTAVGEINKYFTDGKTALVADIYDVAAFAEKMKYVLDYPEASAAIGDYGRTMGLEEFDFRAHATRLKKYLNELSKIRQS